MAQSDVASPNNSDPLTRGRRTPEATVGRDGCGGTGRLCVCLADLAGPDIWTGPPGVTELEAGRSRPPGDRPRTAAGQPTQTRAPLDIHNPQVQRAAGYVHCLLIIIYYS